MLVVDYANVDNISIYDIQFATAIALDNLGETEAAKHVLVLNQLDDIAEEDFATDELLNKIKESGSGLVQGFIHLLYTAPLFKTRSSSLYKSYSYESIVRYIEHTTENELYQQVMRIIASYEPNDYIVLYMGTKLWRNFFKDRAVPNVREVSSDVIDMLHESFKVNISKYSANGSYNTKSKTPNAFLIGTYNAYFRYKKEYCNIVNSRSIMSATSDEDGRSLADKMLNDDSTDNAFELERTGSDDINFVELAGKIYEASYSLFNHGNDRGIAYSDIFTWYKRKIADGLKEQNKKALANLKDYYDVSYVNNIQELSQEASKKQTVRYAICDEFEYLLHNGLTIEDIYPFFVDIAEKQRRLAKDGKNGLALYSWGGLNSKKGNNVEKFQKHYEGFLALRELLNYLNSPKNDTGVDIFSFPIQIFRDKRLLVRFRNIYEYIALYKDAIELIQDAASSPDRAIHIDDNNLYNNDFVYQKMLDIMSSRDNISDLLHKAYNINLSAAGKIVNMSKEELYNVKITQPLNEYNDFANKQGLHPLAEQNYDNLAASFVDGNHALIYTMKLCMQAYKVFTKGDMSEALQRNVALAVIASVDVMLEVLGQPLDNNGSSLVKNRTITELLIDAGIPNEHIKVPLNGGTMLNCVDTIKKIFNASVGIIMSKPADTVSLETVFNVSRILNGTIWAIKNCQDTIKEESNYAVNYSDSNYFLCYAKVINQCSILRIQFPAKDLSEIAKYQKKNYIINTDKLSQEYNIKDAIEEKKRNTAEMLQAINDYLQQYSSLLEVFYNFNDLAKDTLRVIGNASGLSPRKYDTLVKLSIRIKCEFLQNDFANALDVICKKWNCHFDEQNYLRKNNDYVTLQNGMYFIHQYGYKVLPGVKDENLILDVHPDILQLTEADLSTLEIMVR